MAVDTIEATDAPQEPPPEHRPVARRERRRTGAILLPVLLVVVAAVLRLAGLDVPDRIYFDETYYANDAQQLLERGVEEGFVVHPPVGKWLIAAGIQVLGFTPVGWRAAAALAGALAVGVCYLVGLRLFRHRGAAALGALLLALDGVALSMSRIAMLDVFLLLFLLVGTWLLLKDRDVQWEGVEAPPGGQPPPPDPQRPLPRRSHRWRWAAGLAFGLALATKWSALLGIGAAGLFVLGSELAWRQRLVGRWNAKLGRVVASGVLTLVVVPAVVYVASYGAWFANYEQTRPYAECRGAICTATGPRLAVEVLRGWASEQAEIARFHRDLDADHAYRASPTTWPTLRRPIAYYFEDCTPDRPEDRGPCEVEPGNVAEIMALGNPAIWWPALLAYPFLAFAASAWRDWRAATILLLLLGQYLPWLAPERAVFLFYALPLVPFIGLSLAYAGWRALHTRWLRWIPALIAVVAVAGFLYWYPVIAGLEMPREAWETRMWLPSWI